MKKWKNYNQGAIGTIVIFVVIAFIGAATLIGTNLVKDRDEKQTSESRAEYYDDEKGEWFPDSSENDSRSPVGHVSIYCDYIRGWTCDWNNFSRDPVTVEIYDGSKLVGTTIANRQTGDGDPGIGDQCRGSRDHEFLIMTPHALKDGLPHNIRVKAKNQGGRQSDTWLIGSDVLKTCPTCSVSVSNNLNTLTATYKGRSNNTNIRLWLERIDYKAIGDGEGLGKETVSGDGDNTYYLLHQKKSTGYSEVTGSFVLPKTLPTYGDYWFHCDTTEGNGKCSGSPACKYEGISGGGMYGCEGWSSCSSSDNRKISFTQSTPTPKPPSPTPTPRPRPTSTPTPRPPNEDPTNTPIPRIRATNTPGPSCPKKAQGDANCDDVIDIKDYEIILSALQGNDISDLCDDVEDCSADINGDSNVTILDYTIWLNSFLNINSTT